MEARAFTNIAIFSPDVAVDPPSATSPATSGYFIETPASIACIYGLVVVVIKGCNPNTVRTNPVGGKNLIVIVDAYHAPNLDGPAGDLAVFSQRFGVVSADLEIVYASGNKPKVDKGWELEETLDVEWAHAMSPSAKIILVEADTSSLKDLMAAEVKAGELLSSTPGEISNSWGGGEFPVEASNDSFFVRKGAVYFAATGDSPGVSYPATSPNMVAVGGTSIVRDAASGEFVEEVPWASAGAGISQFEPRPTYQNGIASQLLGRRGVADISAVADPSTGGVWVYDSDYTPSNKGWVAIGGTSVATPIVAAIANNSGRFLDGSRVFF